MSLKKISLLVALFGLLISSLHAQYNPYGLPYIRNYHFAQTGGGEQNWCITQDQRGVIYVGNEEEGILEFDGSSWRTIPVPNNVITRSIITGEDGVVYAGLEGDFGRLEPDYRGSLHFSSLMDSLTKENYPDISFWKIYSQEGKVYFCSMDAIFVYDPSIQETSVITLPENSFFSYFVNYELYTSNWELGLMKYQGNEFISLPGAEFFREKSISGLIALDPQTLLVGTYFKGLFLLDLEDGSIDSSFVNPTVMQDLASNMIVNLLRDERNIYVGTKDKGLIVLDTLGEVSEVISEEQGLLDNTITQVYPGSQGTGGHSIWISHWKGISRVDLDSPFRMQSIGPRSMGMDGRGQGDLITDMVEFGGEIFVSTLGGIYHRPYQSERPWFRNIRGIRDEINDLQVIQPSAGLSYLVASGSDKTYVFDQNLNLSTLPAGGSNVLTDPDNPAIFYTGNYDFHGFQYSRGTWKEILKVEVHEPINQMCMDTYSYVWISTRDGLRRLDAARGQDTIVRSFKHEQGLPEEENLRVFKDPLNQEVLVGSSNGFYRFDYQNNRFSPDTAYNSILPEGNNSIHTVHKGAEDLYWFSFNNEFRGWSTLAARLTAEGLQPIYDQAFRALSSRVPTEVFFTDSKDQLWFSKSNELFHFDDSKARDTKDLFEVLVRKVSIIGDSILFNGSNYLLDPSGQIQPLNEQTERAQPRLKHIYRDVSFSWSAPYFKQENQIRYSYFLDGFSTEWSDWSWARSAKINNLKHGKYVMQVKARNAYGEESPIARYSFIILRPWYATITAIFIYIILITSLVVFVILYTRSLKSRAELLERQNKEIELQRSKLESLNEEITSQRDEIEAQRDSISNQNELIDSQNRAMTDSIHYARRIQDAVMPAPEVMRYLLPKHFVFYRPRDIVSGDFFWVDKRDDTVLIAVADCTGHGVPGAFMSMLGISLLNEISSKYGDQPTNELMDELRDQLIEALGQTGDRYEARDGIEMGLVAINTKTREIQFTGANHHLYTFQKGELVVIKGDRMPVGIHAMSSTLFTSHSLKLNRGDSLYLFSDGYVDQFGGEHRKKYGSARLKTLLADLQQNIMHDQKEALEKEFDDWKGDHEQIDDVLMIGIKL